MTTLEERVAARRDPEPGERVHVYYNLHRGGLSVRRRGKIVLYTDEAVLEDCRFNVQPAKRKRARESGVRDICAYVSGLWVEEEARADGRRVKFDLFGRGYFYEVETDDRVDEADRAEVVGTTVYIYSDGGDS